MTGHSTADKVAYVRAATQTRKHACHWPGCGKQVKPAMWGCFEHWHRLPQRIRNAIMTAYRPGQEEDGRPSPAYLVAAQDAQDWIAINFPNRGAPSP